MLLQSLSDSEHIFDMELLQKPFQGLIILQTDNKLVLSKNWNYKK